MGFCRRCRTFYAIYNEGGIYMDSDIFILKRFDHLIPEHGFVTFQENEMTQLQAAFFMGEKGNAFCKEVFEYYNSTPFLNPDGTYNTIISPITMYDVAKRRGYLPEDKEQHLPDDIIIYPAHYVIPRHKYPTTPIRSPSTGFSVAGENVSRVERLNSLSNMQ